jgi:predicted DNA-binding transcriptional regulator AlpA
MLQDMGAVKSMKEPKESRRFLDRSEVAEMLGLSVKTLDGWALQGIGPRFRRLGHKAVRYERADVEAFIQKSPIGGGPTAA